MKGFELPKKRTGAPAPSQPGRWGVRLKADLTASELDTLTVLAQQFLSVEVVERRRLLGLDVREDTR